MWIDNFAKLMYPYLDGSFFEGYAYFNDLKKIRN
jgi:hypothetical protein